MFYTGSNIAIEFEKIPDAILAYYEKNKDLTEEVSILIGTDSQNFDQTKCVSVICVIAKSHGGIFFYEISRIPLIRDVRRKLYIPNIVFWNVASRHDVFHADKSRTGVQLVSGQAASVFGQVMRTIGMNPVEAMEKIIGSERYAAIAVA